MSTLMFILCVLFCLYTYVGFPVLLHLRARFFNKNLTGTGSATQPDELATAQHMTGVRTVTIVVAAHNEAANLARKIASLDALTYPSHLLQCVFVSDGSTDSTVEILRDACASRDNWKLVAYSPAKGKPTALNAGVAKASGDILIFMDARQQVSPTGIDALVRRLDDPAIGAVSGELVLADDRGGEASNVSLYWQYEKWIRTNESALGSTTGATGALYAIRREDYRPLAADTLLDDFETPVALLKSGLRTVFEPGAKVFDQAEPDTKDEFHRKVRTLTGNFQSFARNLWLFSPRSNPVWWQFLSHKVFRLLVPYAMVLALLASWYGNTVFLKTMFALQVLFYLLGIAAMLGLNNRICTIIKIFLQLNAAAVVGAWQALKGGVAIRWKDS